MKSAYTLAGEFRLTLLTRDKVARAELLAAYQHFFRAIEEEIRNVAERIVRAKGSPYLFSEQRRLHELQRQVAEAITRLGHKAASIAMHDQYVAVTAARHQAVELIAAKASRAGVEASFDTFPAGTIEELVGFSHRAPITEVFNELAQDIGQITTQRIKHAMVRGVALGENPATVTRRILREANQTHGNSTRDPVVVRRLRMTIRNETFRSYRRATLETYKNNSDVVQRWRWVSRKSPTTCILCFARDGKTFPLSTPFTHHVNCRCVSVPVLADEDERYVTGVEAFDELEVGVQKDILGVKGYEAYAGGKLGIDDFVGQTTSRKWGPGLTRLSVDDALARRKKRVA